MVDASSTSNPRRTLQERIEAIFEFIEHQEGAFPKSRLKEVGLNPRTAEKWLRLIEYIQEQPKIRLISSGHNTLIEKTEGKYQALMRKMVSDKSVPFEERLQYNTDYLRSLYSRERMSQAEQIQSFISNSTLDRFREGFHLISLIDPRFEIIYQKLLHITTSIQENMRSYEVNKLQKSLIKDPNYIVWIKELLGDNSIEKRIQTILKQKVSISLDPTQWKTPIIDFLRM